MRFSEGRNFTRGFIILASFLIIVLIVWNTYYLFQTFKHEERRKMELWVQSIQITGAASNTMDELLNLPQGIVANNTNIPIILTDKDGNIVNSRNIDPVVEKDTTKLNDFLEQMKKENQRIQLKQEDGGYFNVYYANSPLLVQLKYFPIALILIIVLFGALVYNFYRATKIATQNKLWAGMAKETAHQIGTPLSSLLGWIEIMKADNVDETTVEEVTKDVNRLQTIAERFSKIGSEPVLLKLNIVEETAKTFEYLRSRTSNQVEFLFKAPTHPVYVMLNPELHSWTVENLVKNAIDAMKGKGILSLVIDENEKQIKIKVSDTGKGIPKKQFRKIFEPGFTTKKRGWGLGLSLTRRIVEEYHKGRIKVLNSEIDKGTTMQASYNKV